MNNKVKLAYATNMQAIRKGELEDEMKHLITTARNAAEKGYNSLALKLLAKHDRLVAKLEQYN